MKIFDNVTVNPATLNPTWQGVLGVATLLVNSFVEAEKIRDERVAKTQVERQEPTTLTDVMEQSGLKIPHLHDALATFMGGTDEAKEAATLIVNNPDPINLLRNFAKQYAPASAANEPIVTPPPATPPAQPTPTPPVQAASETANSPRTKPAAFRPEFTREGLEAATKAAGPRPKPAAFRPEFTREGLEAAARAGLPPGTLVPFASAAAPATAAPPTAPVTASLQPRSLADALADRLAALTRNMDAHHAELETRVCCAEAELAQLDEQLENLRVMNSDRPALFVISSTDETESPLPDAAPPQVEDPPAPILAVKDADTSTVALPKLGPASTITIGDADNEPAAVAPAYDGPEAAGAAAPPVTGVSPATEKPLPPATSEADLARALEMLNTFADQLGGRYAGDSERLRLLERKISVMRGRVEHARGHVAVMTK